MIRLRPDIVLGVCSLSPYPCEPFLRSASLGQGAVLDRRVFLLPQKYFYSLPSTQNSIIEFKTKFVIKFNFQSILYV
jgi:hypothetical protein